MSASRIKKEYETARERQTDRLECNKTEVSLERNGDKESGTDMLNMWCILEGGRSG